MATIPDDVLDEIRRRTDLGQVIGRYVRLTKKGRDLLGLCPFHQEKTPSFNVHPDRGFYKCFGCNEAGDVFKFLTKVTGQSFGEVARTLAEEAGVQIPEQKYTPQQQQNQNRRKHLVQILDLAQHYFRAQLASDGGRIARSYLRDVRGLRSEEIEKFALGFGGLPDSGLRRFLDGEHIDSEDVIDAGLVGRSERGAYELFRQRITVPIRGTNGNIISFGGRIFGENTGSRPKYVNGPATDVYDKSRTLFGLYEALPALRQNRAAVLVEGYLDVMALHRVGIPTAVAPCGTSLTALQVEELKRRTQSVTLCLDSDKAGQTASEKALLLFLYYGFDVSIVRLLDKDPDAMVQAGREDELKRMVDGAPSALDVLVERAAAKAAQSVRESINAFDEVLPYIAAIERDLVRETLVDRVAQTLKMNPQRILDEVSDRGQKLLEDKLRGYGFGGQNYQNNQQNTHQNNYQNIQESNENTYKSATGYQKYSKNNAYSGGYQNQNTNSRRNAQSNYQQNQQQSAGYSDAKIGYKTGYQRNTNSNNQNQTHQTHQTHQTNPTNPINPINHDVSAREMGAYAGKNNRKFTRRLNISDEFVTTWSDADRLFAKALLCHPSLATKCDVLTSNMPNRELADFVDKLRHSILKHQEMPPVVALYMMHIPKESLIGKILLDVLRGGAFFDDGHASGTVVTFEQAEAMIDDYISHVHEYKNLQMLIRESERALAVADEQQDTDAMQSLLQERSIVWEKLRRLRDQSSKRTSDVSESKNPAHTQTTQNTDAKQPRQNQPTIAQKTATAAQGYAADEGQNNPQEGFGTYVVYDDVPPERAWSSEDDLWGDSDGM